MLSAKHVTVKLANRPGRLTSVLSALTKEKVDLLALSVSDPGDRGTLRFVPDDFALAKSALETLNVKYEVTDVLLAEVPNQNGAFRRMCERLAAEHLNIDFVYCGKGTRGGLLAVIKVNDLAKAQRLLSEAASNGKERIRRRERRPVRAR